jgi:hypothetical protein
MSDDESTEFSHPIAKLIMKELVEGEKSTFALDDASARLILKHAREALETPEAEDMADTLIDVAEFLEEQDGAEASARLMEISKVIEAKLEGVGSEFEGFDDDDEVEKTYGRRAKAILGKKHVGRAPELGVAKPEGAVSLQALIGTKRRM